MSAAAKTTISMQIGEEVAANTSFKLACEKNGKDESVDLAKLSALLDHCKEQVACAQQPEAEGSEGAAGGASSFEQAMGQLAMAMEMLQVTIGKYNNESSQLQSGIASAQQAAAANNLAQAQQNLEEMAAQENKQSKASFWEKLCSAVVTAVTIIAAAVTLNPALIVAAVISVTMLVCSLTGALQKGTAKLASALQNMFPNMSSNAANIIASVILVVAAVVATAAACPSSLFEVAADEAEEGVAEGTSEAGAFDPEGGVELDDLSSVDEEADTGSINNDIDQETEESASKIKTILSAIRPSAKTSTVLSAATQVAQQSGLPADLAEVCGNSEAAQIGFEIGFALLSMGFSANAASLAPESLATDAEEGSGRFAQLVGKFKGALSELNMKQFSDATFATIVGAQIGESVASVELGATMIAEGRLQEAMAVTSSTEQLLSVAQNQAANVISSSNQAAVNMEKAQNTNGLYQLMNGMQAFASLSSPV